MKIIKNKKTIFLTGATGLVGSHLLKTFLKNGHRVYVLARERNYKKAKDRVTGIIDFWDRHVLRKNSDNLFVCEGDVTEEGLGLNERQREILKDSVEEIVHAAAITDLNLPLHEIQKVNVEGTRNVLELASVINQSAKFLRVNHISTAYLYGDFKGVFTENSLDVRQRFANNYEETKFKGELLVEEYRKKGLWVDIYRPSIVVGDSQSGKNFQFKHIYQFIELCRTELFDSLPLRGCSVSLVPVDLLSEAIYKIWSNTKERSKTYHPFPQQRISVSFFIDMAAELLNFKTPRLVALDDFRLQDLTPAQQAILKNSILSVNFKAHPDSSATNAILKKFHFTFSEIDNKMLTRILQYYFRKKESKVLIGV